VEDHLPRFDGDLPPPGTWLRKFDGALFDLEQDCAGCLDIGIVPDHGEAGTVYPYLFFVQRLYGIWRAKRADDGIYQSQGTHRGPFVHVVERCEALLPEEYRPQTEGARGRRIARAIGAIKTDFNT
jgi:hypothetical protein